MAYTYSKITSYTVGSGGISSVDFLAIPQNYTDLLVKISSRSSTTGSTGDLIKVQYNYSGGTAYSDRGVYGDSSTVPSNARSGNAASFMIWTTAAGGTTATVFGSAELLIPNYTSSYYKSYSAESATENNSSSAGGAYQLFASGLWANTSPITAITFTLNVGSFDQYSTFTLYGIKAEV